MEIVFVCTKTYGNMESGSKITAFKHLKVTEGVTFHRQKQLEFSGGYYYHQPAFFLDDLSVIPVTH